MSKRSPILISLEKQADELARTRAEVDAKLDILNKLIADVQAAQSKRRQSRAAKRSANTTPAQLALNDPAKS